MARNGSGTYSLVAGNPVVTGSTISSTWANNTLTDIATALTGSIAADGQTPITANIPMSSYKFTGLAAGSANGDSVRYEQLTSVTSGKITNDGGTVGGTGDAITLTPSTAITSYAASVGQAFLFKASAANTVSPPTIAISGLAALNTTMGSVALPVGGIISGNYYFALIESATSIRVAPYDAASVNGDRLNGLISMAAGADIASATTIDLTAATGNSVVITGTTTTTALTMNAGQQMILLPSGAWPLTYHATTMNINGGASYTCSAGDRLYCTKDLAGVIRVSVVKQDGTAVVASISVPQTYISGLTLSPAGSSMTISAGQATDSTNAVIMTLASAISKTTGSWTVGTGNGGKMSAAALAAGWYHFYEIYRSDTGVVDVGFDVSATSPTLPTGYTNYRRIGSVKNDGTNWILFTQTGDYFRLSTSVLDVSTTNPGTAAVTATLGSIPTGVKVKALINFNGKTTGTNFSAFISDLSAADVACMDHTGAIVNPGSSGAIFINSGYSFGYQLEIMTNTSAQIRYRADASDANTSIGIVTLGWTDTRGKG